MCLSIYPSYLISDSTSNKTSVFSQPSREPPIANPIFSMSKIFKPVSRQSFLNFVDLLGSGLKENLLLNVDAEVEVDADLYVDDDAKKFVYLKSGSANLKKSCVPKIGFRQL